MDARDTIASPRRSAALKASATKGEAERSRAASKANWTRANGKDDARDPFTRTAPASGPGADADEAMPAPSSTAHLYFWRRYREDTAAGSAPLRLNQNSAAMRAISPRDVVWAFASVGSGRYAVVARFSVARVGENPPGSRARRDDGRWWFEAESGGATYFDEGDQPPFDRVVRKLGIKADAAVLGHSFRGGAGVRTLSTDDGRVVAAHASTFSHRADAERAAVVPPHEADAEPFVPNGIEDARETVARQIKARRGQKEFRDKLLAAYGGRCAITGCRVLDVLEAAHIHPYRGGETNHTANGLLLRADLHTLLDCGLLAVDPNGLSVVVAPSIRGSAYGKLHGRALRPREAGCQGVSVDALRLRFEEFSKRHGT